ncbi:leucyl aminopeptidase family protein [Oceanibium sediminis]|uniref:leucyl aminopeptidase family protein n=1 Tax=Oceanibium sediminis TaxID=2026339 RepID=UPI000DD3C2EC|nr:leucyl aminopeptidase family protein [Oceanibium sediminis]
MTGANPFVLCVAIGAGVGDPAALREVAKASGIDWAGRSAPALLPGGAAGPVAVVALDPLRPEQNRRRAGAAVSFLRENGARNATLHLPDTAGFSGDPRTHQQALIEGALLAGHDFACWKSERRPSLDLHFAPAPDAALLRDARAVAGAASFARDLSATPANKMTPPDFVARMRDLAQDAGFAFTHFGRDALEQMGMGGFLGVSAGSAHDPALVRLDYRPEGLEGPPVVLVGKTVTFDSGGISLKKADGMEQMKADMGGGAAVAGAMQAIAALRPEMPVTALFAVVENMPGTGAMRPSDVLTTYSGKTVEVINTDAEGRLVLADALGYGAGLKPALMVDLATLTGATMGIFGPLGVSTFTNTPAALALLREADGIAGEKIWELPLWDEYLDFLRSPVADLRNFSTTGQMGSTPIAAKFLQQFVEGTPWLHLDLYNTCWHEAADALGPAGPTGSGARVLTQFLILLATSGAWTTFQTH